MSGVNNYVNIMRKQGQMRASANPNSEMSMLKQELIEHYKTNTVKAWALINGIESNSFSNISAEQRLHYDAAVIAVRGYSNANNEPKSSFNPPVQVNELDILKQSGWQVLDKSKESVLLHEKI
jgi:hypothetical protein